MNTGGGAWYKYTLSGLTEYARWHVSCPLMLKFIQAVCVVKLFVRNCCGFYLNAVFTFVFIPLRQILFVFVQTMQSVMPFGIYKQQKRQEQNRREKKKNPFYCHLLIYPYLLREREKILLKQLYQIDEIKSTVKNRICLVLSQENDSESKFRGFFSIMILMSIKSFYWFAITFFHYLFKHERTH